MLPIAKLALNNLISLATGTTPFYANFGRHLNLINVLISNPNNNKAIKLIRDLKYTHNKVLKKLEKQQIRMENYENKFRKNRF